MVEVTIPQHGLLRVHSAGNNHAYLEPRRMKMLYKVVRKNGAENTCSLVHGYILVKKGYVVALVRIHDSYVIDVAVKS